MEPILPPLPQQIPARPESGGADGDNFFDTLQDIVSFQSTGRLPPPLTADGFDFEAIMAVNPSSEEELSSWYPSVPECPDVGQSLASGNVTGGVEGSGGRKHRASVPSGKDGGSELMRRAITKEKLEELLRVDPKRAKRIIANRKSAARSKEKKMLEATQVQERVKALQIQLASIDSEIDTVVGENTALAAENEELQMYIDGMEEQVPVRLAEIERLRKRVEQLRIEVMGDSAGTDVPFGAAMQSQYYSPHPQLPLHHQLPPPPPPQYMVPHQPQFGFGMPLSASPPLLPPPPPLPSSSSSQPQFNVQGGPSYSNFNPLNYS